MSLRLPLASAPEVWSYPTRTLTEKYVIIERVGRGFTSGVSEIYRLSTFFRNSKFVLIAKADASAIIKNRSGDLIPTATETILDTGFDPTNAKDHNDSTCSSTTTTLDANASIDHVKWDLGSVANRFLVALISSGTAGVYTRVLVSSDDATYTEVAEVNGGTVKAVYYGSFRYVKLQTINSNVSALSGSYTRFCSVEVYPPNTDTEISLINELAEFFVLLYNGYYQLIEVVYL